MLAPKLLTCMSVGQIGNVRFISLAILASAAASAQPAVQDKSRETPSTSKLWSSAWETLDKGLRDGDPEHRKKALTAAGTIGAAPDAVRRVVQSLHDKNTLVRQKAAATLGEMGSPDAIPDLKAALDDGPEVSFTAAKALSSLGDSSGMEIFWQVMQGERKDGPGFVKGAVRNAKHKLSSGELAVMGAKEAAGVFGPGAFVVDILQETVKNVKQSGGAAGRVVVAGILAKDADPNTVSLLEWALRDDSSAVRGAVAQALGECGNQDTILKLEPLLSDDSHSTRYMAAAAIIRLNLKFAPE
ncbi:MAG: HEAT repeat domain-containing protein [Bryobacteraceae bacterium]